MEYWIRHNKCPLSQFSPILKNASRFLLQSAFLLLSQNQSARLKLYVKRKLYLKKAFFKVVVAFFDYAVTIFLRAEIEVIEILTFQLPPQLISEVPLLKMEASRFLR